MTCSLQYSFGFTRVQPAVEEPKTPSLSTTCIRFTSQKLSKVRNGLSRKKHQTLPSAVNTISAPLELISYKNNEKYFSVVECLYNYNNQEVNERQSSLASFSTATTATTATIATPTSTISSPHSLACSQEDYSVENLDEEDESDLDSVASEDQGTDCSPFETDKSERSSQYYATLQKLMGVPMPEDNRVTSRTNTAVLISLSPCALAAANFARHRRQRRKVRVVA